MRKKHLKRLRRLANDLPPRMMAKKITQHIPGKFLIDHGMNRITHEEGTGLIEPGKLYKRTMTVPVPVNHYKQIKSLYKRFGEKGVEAYCKAIRENQKVVKTHG